MNTALTSTELDAFGRDLDALRDEIRADLGDRDVAHIKSVIRTATYTEWTGRALLHFGPGPLTFALGVAALGTSKILENMEIGHNIMHGQYDWTRDPTLDSRTYEWDIVCDGDDWRHSHNVEHHTYTNILGRDHDIGYGLLRMTDEQPWRPAVALQPFYALALALLFQWGVALHDLQPVDYLDGTRPLDELPERARPFLRKAGWQLFKDYAFFPALSLWNAPRVIAGNALANLIRNVWAFSIIFCGHFPDGVQVHHQDELADESRAAWYRRQLTGSANFEGSALLHLLSGHLSFQIEHHLFPDLPAPRYREIAPRVQEICERHGQEYNTGSFWSQFGTVVRKIVRLALPPAWVAA